MVAYNCFRDERLKNLSETHQNQLLWAGLCHDFGKRGKPLFEGKDHIHPFRSAASLIDIFAQNDIISEKGKVFTVQLSEITSNAYVKITKKKELKIIKKSKDTLCDT
mmetsp:Transcript_1248/g.1388  ORF Transcript_1248/g.1388 Transcript_1248/m.1388 type:complete len:107 (-) Transcript_1248:342-662(-)